MFEIISAIIGLIGTTGGKAIDKTTQVIVQEGLTSRAWIEAGQNVATAGWDAVAKSFGSNTMLSKGIADKAKANAVNARAQQAEQDKFKRTLIIVGLCAGALLILIIVLKKK